MKLFGWKSGRDDSRPALARVGAARFGAGRFGATGEWPASYEAQVRAGYQENPVAMRAVKFVMDALAQAPLEPCDERAAALVGMRSGGQALLSTIAAHLLLHGNAYVQLLRDADGGLSELYALRPERVSVEADAVTSLALCWRVERRDGVAVGLTDHDRHLLVDGLLHRAAPGMTPSAIERSDGLEPDTMDVGGALTSSAIGETDLLAGRWDGARVDLFAVDWTAIDAAPVPLGGGTIGAVETRDGAFTAELSGPTAALTRPAVEETSAECRAELGDRRCRVAMRGRTRTARVMTADDATLTLDRGEPTVNAYGQGRLRWLSGANCGLESAIAESDGATATLREPPAFAVVAGTLVRLSEGCDKALATCAERFGNAVNFRGEPYLPGIDLLTRYPGA